MMQRLDDIPWSSDVLDCSYPLPTLDFFDDPDVERCSGIVVHKMKRCTYRAHIKIENGPYRCKKHMNQMSDNIKGQFTVKYVNPIDTHLTLTTCISNSDVLKIREIGRCLRDNNRLLDKLSNDVSRTQMDEDLREFFNVKTTPQTQILRHWYSSQSNIVIDCPILREDSVKILNIPDYDKKKSQRIISRVHESFMLISKIHMGLYDIEQIKSYINAYFEKIE